MTLSNSSYSLLCLWVRFSNQSFTRHLERLLEWMLHGKLSFVRVIGRCCRFTCIITLPWMKIIFSISQTQSSHCIGGYAKPLADVKLQSTHHYWFLIVLSDFQSNLYTFLKVHKLVPTFPESSIALRTCRSLFPINIFWQLDRQEMEKISQHSIWAKLFFCAIFLQQLLLKEKLLRWEML